MKRQLIIAGDIANVPLTQGYYAIIDADDVGLVEGHNWSALVSPKRNAVYAVRTQVIKGKSVMILLHRILLGAPAEMQVDHKDGDGLNCRRSNMRLCTHAENQLNKAIRPNNTSGFKGVCWDNLVGKWKAEICLMGTRKFLGHFSDPEEAHAAYVAAATTMHGEFARVT